jgi:hypothetical protein
MMKKAFAFLTLAITGMMAVGCCSTVPLNVTVNIDDAMRQRLESRNLEVDLVALNSKQSERWETYSMTSYWQPGDALRDSVDSYKMIFDPTKNQPQTLSSKDPHWSKWFAQGAGDKMKLYVLVGVLPGSFDDQPGDKDARRQILPLESCRWSSTDVHMTVQKTGIITTTPPKPEN